MRNESSFDELSDQKIVTVLLLDGLVTAPDGGAGGNGGVFAQAVLENAE